MYLELVALSAETEPAKGGFQIPSLDGVRGIAVLLVVASHAGYRFASAALGVNAFFFLSGFLITTLLRREHAKSNAISFRKFYIRRTLRIFPPMYLTLVAVLVLVATGVVVSDANPGAIVAQFFHLTNYTLVTHHRVLPGTEMMWSLSVEEHFYLCFPLLFTFLVRLSPRQSLSIVISVCLIVFAWRSFAIITHLIPSNWAYQASDTRIDSILWGCAMALFLNPYFDAERARKLDRPWLGAVAVVGLVATQAFRADWYSHTFRYTLQCLCFFPLFVMAIRRPTQFPFTLLNRQPLVWIGTISYSLYLYHHVVVRVLEEQTTLKRSALMLVTLALSLPLCWLSYRLIEQPAGRLRKRFSA